MADSIKAQPTQAPISTDQYVTKDRMEEMWTFLKDMKSTYAELSKSLGEGSRKTMELGAQLENEKKTRLSGLAEMASQVKSMEETMFTKAHNDNLLKSMNDMQMSL